MDYVELRCHSAFSFGDGAVTPEALVERAAALGYGALGLTDTADLGGIIRFALEAERRGVRPVIGAELHVDGHPAAFLVQSEEGYRNLASLVTRARIGSWGWWRKEGEEEGEEGGSMAAAATRPTPGGNMRAPGGTTMAEWDRLAGREQAHVRGGAWSAESPRRREAGRVSAPPKDALVRRGHPGVTWDDVARHAAGLFALTGPASGELGLLLHQGRAREAARLLARWRELFEGRVAVEVQLHNVSGGEQALGAALIELAGREETPWVVTNDPRYTDGGSRLVHDLLIALRADVCVDTAACWGLLHPNGEWRLKGPEEMRRLWQGREEGLAESVRIAGDCAFDLRWLRPPLPRFPGHPGEDDDAFLARMTFAGATERWGEMDERQRAQLEH
ncbi:MAG TPA: PHP domain-containing protein [Longimicrobiales bacterium]|nr:PHP domain-containing protein [Longimicrobiales bacterium]